MNALQDSVHRLTREHLATDKNGVLRVTPALLAELRLALTPGRNSSGNGGSEGAPIPIDPTALDMLRDIEEKIPAHRSETDHSELCLSHIVKLYVPDIRLRERSGTM